MRTNRITVVAFVLGWMLSATIGAAVGSVIAGQDKNTQPSCTALSGNRGRLWFNESASGTSDYMQLCMVDASGTYSWNAVKSSAFTSTDNALARFDGVTGGLQNGLSTENDDGGVTLSSSLTLTGDANISDDLFVTDDATIGDALTAVSVTATTGAVGNNSIRFVAGTAQINNTANTATLAMGNAAAMILTPSGTYPVTIGTAGSKVACAVGNRGSIFYEAGGAGVADIFYVCSKAAADTYAWRDIALVTP